MLQLQLRTEQKGAPNDMEAIQSHACEVFFGAATPFGTGLAGVGEQVAAGA